MVKLTALLLTGTTLLAMSSSSAHAAVARETNDALAYTGADDHSLIFTDPVVAQDFNNTETFPVIIDDGAEAEDDDDVAQNLSRRAYTYYNRKSQPSRMPKTPKTPKSPKPPKSSKPPKSNTGLTSEQQKVLDIHNAYRARHGSPPMTWDHNVAAFAQRSVRACQFRHTGGPYGENLAAGHRSFSHAIKNWYDEEKMYDYNRPGFSRGTGHFTAMVWKSSTALGCAKVRCPQWTIYQCNYSPAGNNISNNGQYFRQNVLPRRG